MSDESGTEQTETTTDTTDTEAGEERRSTTAKAATPRLGTQGLLTRDSDLTLRPGFRNPANKRSKASRKKKGKKRR